MRHAVSLHRTPRTNLRSSVGPRLVSLYAIDAPAAGELCQRVEETWPCGAVVRKALQALVAGGPLWCVQVVRNRHGSVSICRRDGADVNEAMVAAGMARADRLYSSRYVPAEDTARAAGRGLWLGVSAAEVDGRQGAARTPPHAQMRSQSSALFNFG